MKILHLTFQNLNSLTGHFEIDFAEGPLAEAGIFAITGPTGAGKSTILDALTLALFGKAARYDTSKPEDMMSRGTGECFAEVRFQVNGSSYSARWDLTRARKKPTGNLQTPKRQIADHAGTILADKIRDVDEQVTALTGLDYPRFLRSVLLAQGRFKEFLDANARDRGELLERITGTEIYSSLSVLAHEAARDKEEAIKQARTAADLIRLLSDEEKEVVFEEREALTAKEGENAREVVLLGAKLKSHAEQTSLLAAQETLFHQEKRLKGAELAFAGGFKQLTDHDKAAPLQGDLSLWTSKKRAVTQLETRLTGLKSDTAQAKDAAAGAFAAAVASCDREISEIEDRRVHGVGKKKKLISDIEALESWQKSHSEDDGIELSLRSIREKVGLYQSKVQALEGVLKAADLTRQSIRRTEKETAQAEKGQANARKALGEKEAALKAMADALAEQKPKRAWVSQKEAAEKSRSTIQELTRLSKGHLVLLEEKKDLKTDLATQQAEAVKLQADATETAKTLQMERRALGDKELIHKQALAMASLDERRSQLVPGKECPLCGAIDHPYADETFPKPSETEASLTHQQRSVATLEKRENATQRSLAATAATLKSLEAQLSAKIKKCGELSEAFLSLAADGQIEATLTDGPRLDALERENGALLITVAEKITAIETLELEKNGAEKELITACGQAEAFDTRLGQLKETRERDLTQLGSQSEQQMSLEHEVSLHLSEFSHAIAPWNLKAEDMSTAIAAVTDLEKRAAAWRKAGETLAASRHEETKVDAGLETLVLQIARIENERKAWSLQGEAYGEITGPYSAPEAIKEEAHRRTLCEKAVQTLHALEARAIQTAKDTIDATTIEAELQAALVQSLSERGFESLDTLRLSLLDEQQHATLLKEKGSLATEKVRLETLIQKTQEALSALAEENPPTDEEAGTLAARKADIETQRDSLLKRMGEIDAALIADQKARTEQAAQRTKIEALETDAHPWLVLKDLIGSSDGSKFSKFAQGLTLGQLVNLANRHLITLNPRYEIQRIPHEDLELEIIDRYQADAVRPTKSLSGGESFLVSLALALGLSEMAGQKTRIESLFIDEGFGSLDSETLDTALAALENLRLDNRTIGVISHVDLLKNRLGTQIEVTRKADGHATLAIVDG